MSSCEGGHMSVAKPWRRRLRGAIANSGRADAHRRRLTSPWNCQPQATAGSRRLNPSPWWLPALKQRCVPRWLEWGRDVNVARDVH